MSHNTRPFSTRAAQISPVLSEDYSDIIFRYQLAPELLLSELEQFSPQIVDSQYSILHAPFSDQLIFMDQIGYPGVPKLFTSIDTVSLETSGILAAQNQPFLSLTGRGVLIGFLDSGIDYTHPAFRESDGTTRIMRIWDQTIQTGPAPDGLMYGTEYTREQINQALFSQNPYEIVPHRDELGHGTAMAGIACGSPDSNADFTGAAPGSSLIVVKLKPAKQYLRDYFLIPADALAYQETDLMLGIRYMIDVSRVLRMPLVICMTLGSNQGGHTGNTPLEDVLASAQFNTGVYAVSGTGNEVGAGHHYLGNARGQGDTTDVEILVEEESSGFSLEFWADAPELYSIGFTSPLGEIIQPVQPRGFVTHEFNFLLENSTIYLTYALVEMLSGSQMALMRFKLPTPGVWRVRVSNLSYVNGDFHMWLPITGLINPDIRFYTPDTDTTLVNPSCAESIISVGTYDAYTESMFRNSGRGYTRNSILKPSFVSPGVNLTAPLSQSAAASGTPAGALYGTRTGSCAASALTAGATALIVESGLRREDSRYFTPREIKSLFQRGATRSNQYAYPNREMGYGVMDVYGIFEFFLRS